MIPKNCLTVFGAVAAARSVAAQLGIDESLAGGLIPKTLEERLQYCDSGRIDFNSDRPCDLEKAEDARLLAEAQLDPALQSDRENATKVAAYRKGVEASTFRTNAQNCCFDCKVRHKVHSEAQDKYWRSFYDSAKLQAWYSKVDSFVPDKNSTAPPLLWAYLQSQSGGDAPGSDLNTQSLNVTEQKMDSYCPGLSASKTEDKSLSPSAKTSVTFPAPCMDFYAKAEASKTPLANSAKFPKNATVAANGEAVANQFVSCPVCVVDGNQGYTAWSAPAQVEGISIKVSAQIAIHLTPETACSSCTAGGSVTGIPAILPGFEGSFSGGASRKAIENLSISGNGKVSVGSGTVAGPASNKGPTSGPASKEKPAVNQGTAAGPASQEKPVASQGTASGPGARPGKTGPSDEGANEVAWC